eukprot:1724154-Alexandrium_andersonii.AAC.1
MSEWEPLKPRRPPARLTLGAPERASGTTRGPLQGRPRVGVSHSRGTRAEPIGGARARVKGGPVRSLNCAAEGRRGATPCRANGACALNLLARPEAPLWCRSDAPSPCS